MINSYYNVKNSSRDRKYYFSLFKDGLKWGVVDSNLVRFLQIR